VTYRPLTIISKRTTDNLKSVPDLERLLSFTECLLSDVTLEIALPLDSNVEETRDEARLPCNHYL
jgi:hypothetical protein